MKRYGSVLVLAARGVVWKLLALMAAVGAAQGVLFALYLSSRPEGPIDPAFDYELYTKQKLFFHPEYMLQETNFILPAAVGLVLLCLALAFYGCEQGKGRSQYTFSRLRVGQLPVFGLWVGCYALCLLVFWGFQTGMMLGLVRLLMRLGGNAGDTQTLFLACWRNPYLHSLLPLQDWPRLVYNVLLLIALALSLACFSFLRRHGRRSLECFIVTALAATSFARPFDQDMGRGLNLNGLLGFVAVVCGIVVLYRVRGCWNDEL